MCNDRESEAFYIAELLFTMQIESGNVLKVTVAIHSPFGERHVLPQSVLSVSPRPILNC